MSIKEVLKAQPMQMVALAELAGRAIKKVTDLPPITKAEREAEARFQHRNQVAKNWHNRKSQRFWSEFEQKEKRRLYE